VQGIAKRVADYLLKNNAGAWMVSAVNMNTITSIWSYYGSATVLGES
jgi:hypothetical protein